ncbi:MAG: Bacterial non-heme ferritin [Planctomycetes bacterium]|nr:Bacterial non-heme ferritin [Planctomycetota bacterium]
MIAADIRDALNDQINAEQCAAQTYLAMSADLERRGFRGFAAWLRIQSAEEQEHATKLIGIVTARGADLRLAAIPAPAGNHSGPLSVFEEVLKLEIANTARIHALFARARAAGDFATEIALQWYVSEQVEEEATVQNVLDRLRAVGDQGGAVWYLDKEMGKRGQA